MVIIINKIKYIVYYTVLSLGNKIEYQLRTRVTVLSGVVREGLREKATWEPRLKEGSKAVRGAGPGDSEGEHPEETEELEEREKNKINHLFLCLSLSDQNKAIQRSLF